MDKIKKLNYIPENYDEILRFIFIGDKGVGKTSFLKRYVENIFDEKYDETIGSETKIGYYSYKNKFLKIYFCDISGHEKYRSLINLHCRYINYIIIIFDLCNEDSFINIRYWIKDIEKYKKNDTQLILIGNKSDKHQKLQKINDNLGFALAEELGCQYIKSSVKNGENIDKIFDVYFEK